MFVDNIFGFDKIHFEMIGSGSSAATEYRSRDFNEMIGSGSSATDDGSRDLSEMLEIEFGCCQICSVSEARGAFQ